MFNVLSWFARFAPQNQSARDIKSAPISTASDFDEFIASWTGSCSNPRLSAPYIARVLSGADNGASADQAALFMAMLDKEPVIMAHMQTRVLAVLANKWDITANKKTASDITAKRDAVITILNDAGIYELLKHLLSALPFAYAGSAIVWGDGGSVKEFRHVYPCNWTFDLAGNPALSGIDGQEHALASYHPNQFIFHTHQLKPGIPCTGGILRALVWLYFFKHYGLRDRARYIERFGMPFLSVKLSSDDFGNETLKNNILNSLQKMGSDGVGVLTQNSELTVTSPANSSSSDYDSWFKYIDDVYAYLILGQKATAQDASGLSNGQMQENVRRDIMAADCNALMAAVDKQLLTPLENYQYGTKELKFVINYEKQEDLTQKASIVKTLSEAGFETTPEYLSDKFGMPLTRKADNVLPDFSPDELDADPDNTDGMTALALFSDSDDARESYIAELTENTLKSLMDSEELAAFYAPLKSEIKKIFTGLDPESDNLVDEFKNRVKTFFDAYPALYAAMDSKALEDALSGAMLSAAVQGYAPSGAYFRGTPR